MFFSFFIWPEDFLSTFKTLLMGILKTPGKLRIVIRPFHFAVYSLFGVLGDFGELKLSIETFNKKNLDEYFLDQQQLWFNSDSNCSPPTGYIRSCQPDTADSQLILLLFEKCLKHFFNFIYLKVFHQFIGKPYWPSVISQVVGSLDSGSDWGCSVRKSNSNWVTQ